jgi:serine/threonine-protein kinase
MAADLASCTDAKQRFSREAQSAAAIRHDHVVTVYAVDEFRGRPYLVMEYIQGASLQELVKRDGAFPADDVIRLGIEIASRLSAAHDARLIHRDIKPANILLEDDRRRIQITDFGLARATDDVAMTRPGQVAGTPE